MNVVKGTVLLLLLGAVGSIAEPTDEECAAVTKRLPSKDLHKIFGEWVLVWSVSDDELGHSLLANCSSSHVEFNLLPDNKTIEYIERNVYLGSLNSCTTYFTNMTVPSDDAEHHTIKSDSIRVEKDGIILEYNETGDVDFYEGCSDCLLMVYKTSSISFITIYKREGSHRDVEQHKTHHEDHKKLAECLKFPHDKAFVYDGLTDFCHKKSAPVETVDEECATATKRLPSKDLHKIFGEWVLVWSVSDHETGHSLLANCSSSHVEFKLLPDNKTIEYIERNVYLGSLDSCTTYFTNMTVPSDDAEHHTIKSDSIRVEEDGTVLEYNDTGDLDFYEGCSDCLLMVYKTSSFRYLLIYKREGSHRDVEQHKTHHEDNKKLAECLKFPHDKAFVYSGLADFCHKKSAPVETVKES